MQTGVFVPENEWRNLPYKIAKAIHTHSQKEYGFKVVSKETGREIIERLEDWFVGVVITAFQEATAPKNTEELSTNGWCPNDYQRTPHEDVARESNPPNVRPLKTEAEIIATDQEMDTKLPFDWTTI